MVRAELDPSCSACIVARRDMLYRDGDNPALDRPAHVRAASAVCWVGDQLAVVQDDANFIALVEPETGRAFCIALPAGHDDKRLFDELRGTKRFKLDLEACFSIEEHRRTRFFALGSGTKALRERVVTIDFGPDDQTVESLRVIDASSFYAQLHDRHQLIGGELNLEGALVHGDTLLLFQRGNGATREGRASVSGIGRLSWPAFQAYLAAASEQPESARPPPLTQVTRFDLGTIQGVPFSFTDASATAEGGVVFLASAEASSDSTTDGVVLGTRVGIIDPDGRTRMTPLLEEDGKPTRLKAEGIVLDRRNATRAWVVIDMDDPARPSSLLEVALDLTGKSAR